VGRVFLCPKIRGEKGELLRCLVLVRCKDALLFRGGACFSLNPLRTVLIVCPGEFCRSGWSSAFGNLLSKFKILFSGSCRKGCFFLRLMDQVIFMGTSNQRSSLISWKGLPGFNFKC